jgi:hypothetical protein
MPEDDRDVAASLPTDLRHDLEAGLLYVHQRLADGTSKTLEGASFLYALIELLGEKGLITIDELDERKRTVWERLAQRAREQGLGVVIQDPEHDKYGFEQVEIDCASRLEHCRAACCRLGFALSRQDVREGIVHWDLARPYVIAQDADGYCSHLDRGCLGCTVRAHRPVPCRAFDCRKDPRIWVDFENRVPNPRLGRADWPQCEAEPGGSEAGP